MGPLSCLWVQQQQQAAGMPRSDRVTGFDGRTGRRRQAGRQAGRTWWLSRE